MPLPLTVSPCAGRGNRCITPWAGRGDRSRSPLGGESRPGGEPATVSRVDRLDILGVRVDDVTYAETLAAIEQYVAARAPRYVVTPNPEFVMLARRDAAFRAALAGA